MHTTLLKLWLGLGFVLLHSRLATASYTAATVRAIFRQRFGTLESREGLHREFCAEWLAPGRYDAPRILHELYGEQFDPESTEGEGGIVVLGMHNSGTSMVTRLVMLLGAFAGNQKHLAISKRNPLKYYERKRMYKFHDRLIAPYVDRAFQIWHMQDLRLDQMEPIDHEAFECFAQSEMKDIRRHEPWVVKDPRMGQLMSLWKPHMPEMTCLIVLKDPIKLATSLAANIQKSVAIDKRQKMTAQRWLDMWEKTLRDSLEGCRGAPTVLFSMHDIETDVDTATEKLKRRLEAAGVRGLKMPSKQEMQKKIRAHLAAKGDRPQQRKLLEETSNAAPGSPNSQLLPSPSQVALQSALMAYLQRFDAGEHLKHETVADGILNLADSLEAASIVRIHQRPELFHTH